jgi:hypothetical protein
VGPPPAGVFTGKMPVPPQGAHAGEYQALRAQLSHPLLDERLPGELLAAAFLHLVDPSDPGNPTWLRLIAAALGNPGSGTTDPLELALALDWCWPDLPAEARQDFLFRLHKRTTAFSPVDSPFDPRHFRERLAQLALAVAIDETDEPSPSWTELRQQLLDSGRTYFTQTFPTFVQWRTVSPTSPAAAAREECDTVLAIEIAGRLLGDNLWPNHAESVGRWLEHYVLAASEHPALQHEFIRDDGTEAPLTPVPAWRDLLPLTAHLLAVRTRDPAGAWLAGRVETTLRAAGPDDPRGLWRWVPIAFDTTDVPRCDPARLPPARNLGGAVVLRGGRGPDATTVWIDAGQPFLRRRQHFDAGHFLICRGGELTVHGGDDVSLEAVAGKSGSQHLGNQREPFDFEQYFTASIAHNCLVVWEPARVAHWYKAQYWPIGGQRCVEDTCTDFAKPLEAQGRLTGRQLAYGQHEDAAYLALGLTPAYDSRSVSTYTREFVLVWGRALVVIDRVSFPRGKTVPTWVLNIPARPSVDGADLSDAARVAGKTSDSGVWRCDNATWLRWTDRDGALWFAAPLPTPHCCRVVGGPARKLLVTDGRHAERTYVGGDADGFEHLVIPAERRGALNGWYRLGVPTLLGPEFGRTPHWGRIELEPMDPGSSCTFLTVLITDRAEVQEAPSATLERDADALVLNLHAGDERATLRVPADVAGSGTLEVQGPRSFSWTLPTKVLADEPLPTAVAAPD